MKRRKFILGTATASIGGSALLGSGAFSRVDSHRNVHIEIVGDDDAYLRLEYPTVEIVDCAGTVTLLTITNRLKAAIDGVEFELIDSDDNLDVEDIELPDTPIGVGEQGEVTAVIACSEDVTSRVGFEINVGGTDLAVEAHRTDADAIDVECACPCNSETAWTDGEPYNPDGKGNWATYTPWEDGMAYDLIAGQHMDAGTATFSEIDGNVEITIDLHDGWSLQDVEEPVKIQGYDEAPSGNPAPGQFSTSKGGKTNISVEKYPYYGVHLDVEKCGKS